MSDKPAVNLRFVGDGSEYVPGVALEDLYDVDAVEAEGLIGTGLYELMDAAEPSRAALVAQAKAMGLSGAGSKVAIAARIAEAEAVAKPLSGPDLDEAPHASNGAEGPVSEASTAAEPSGDEQPDPPESSEPVVPAGDDQENPDE